MPNYEFDVLIHGKSTTKYAHEGRYYIEGRPGSEFTLLVRNNTGSRILAVMTVDGLSIMDGKKGSLDGNGYVVNPYQTLKIPGWRLDDDDVAKFVFQGKGKSYAAKKGNTRNVGVIGCAIFQEDCPSYVSYPSTTWTTLTYTDSNFDRERSSGEVNVDWVGGDTTVTCDSRELTCDDSSGVNINYCSTTPASQQGSVSSSNVLRSTGGSRSARRVKSRKMSTQNIGTGFGKKASHEVTEVSFSRKDRPAEVFAIHYDDKKGLEARGINLSRKVHVANPFPKDAEKGCTPPADWQG